MVEFYTATGGKLLAFVLIVGLIYLLSKNSIAGKIFKVSGIILLVMLFADIMFDISASSKTKTPTPEPPIEQPKEKPKPFKFAEPDKSFYKESYETLAAKTGLRVTDTWLLEFSERVTPDGNVDTHGFVEFNNDGVKRQFWLVFDGKTRKILRVKIDSELIYSEIGW